MYSHYIAHSLRFNNGNSHKSWCNRNEIYILYILLTPPIFTNFYYVEWSRTIGSQEFTVHNCFDHLHVQCAKTNKHWWMLLCIGNVPFQMAFEWIIYMYMRVYEIYCRSNGIVDRFDHKWNSNETIFKSNVHYMQSNNNNNNNKSI